MGRHKHVSITVRFGHHAPPLRRKASLHSNIRGFEVFVRASAGVSMHAVPSELARQDGKPKPVAYPYSG